MPSKGLDILPGQQTSISVKKTITKRLGEPYNKCINLHKPDDYESLLYKSILSKSIRYSRSYCMDTCFQYKLDKKCKCIASFYPTLSNEPSYCQSVEEINCVYEYFGLYYGKY